MGLDMYLYREQFVSGWNYSKDADTSLYDTILEATGLERCEGSPHAMLKVCVAYWSKANAIHGWFVRELAGGVDECQPIHVPIAKLRELRDKAEAMLNVPANFRANVAEKSGLTSQSGFFFGSTDYDDWYIEDMKHTVKQIDAALASIPADASDWDYSFIYQASW